MYHSLFVILSACLVVLCCIDINQAQATTYVSTTSSVPDSSQAPEPSSSSEPEIVFPANYPLITNASVNANGSIVISFCKGYPACDHFYLSDLVDVSSGNVTIESRVQLELSGTLVTKNLIILQGGLLFGSGTIIADTVTNYGTLKVGGNITILGEFNNLGKVSFNYDSDSPEEFGRLYLSANYSLGNDTAGYVVVFDGLNSIPTDQEIDLFVYLNDNVTLLHLPVQFNVSSGRDKTCQTAATKPSKEGYNGCSKPSSGGFGLLVTSQSSPDCTYIPPSTVIKCVCDHGVCEGTVCVCTPGWEGSDCSIMKCPGEPECTGHGFCTLDDTVHCSCNEGWHGDNCTEPTCPSAINGTICSGHGQCYSKGYTPECLCDKGWTGPDCTTVTEVCPGEPACLGDAHGYCNETSQTCVCTDNYLGSSCSVPVCPGDPDCNSHGFCLGSAVCQCMDGWTGNLCDEMKEDVCGPGNQCWGHGDCATNTNPPHCVCQTGWLQPECKSQAVDMFTPPLDSAGNVKGTSLTMPALISVVVVAGTVGVVGVALSIFFVNRKILRKRQMVRRLDSSRSTTSDSSIPMR